MTYIEKLGERAGNTLLANQTATAGALTDFTVPEDRIVARLTGENVKAASPAEIATLLNADLAGSFVTLGTAQTISGQKTFSSSIVMTSSAMIELDGFSSFSVTRQTSGKTQLIITSLNSDADLRMTHDNDFAQSFELGAKGPNVQMSFGATVSQFIMNAGNGSYARVCDVVVRDDGGADMFRADVSGKNVSVGSTTPNARAKLDLQSTTQGLLPPRMTTTQRNAISTVAGDAGLEVYDTDIDTPFFWDGTAWQQVGTEAAAGAPIAYSELKTSTVQGAQGLTTTPAKITGWTTVGEETGLTASAANDEITLPAGIATYRIDVFISFSGENSTIYELQAYEDTTAIAGLEAVRTIGTGSDIGSTSLGGYFTAAGGEKISVYANTRTGTGDFVMERGDFRIQRVE